MNRYIRFMESIVIKSAGGRRRAYPAVSPRVQTHIGSGRLIYGTDDGYLGVQLDGETRIDEYPAELVTAGALPDAHCAVCGHVSPGHFPTCPGAAS